MKAKRRLSTLGTPEDAALYLDAPFGPLVRATLVERPNRFLVIARLGDRRVRAASRDPGRLRELLVPGAELLLEPSDDSRRRTAYTLVLVRKGRQWVSAVPALANGILEAAVRRGGAPGLQGATILAREVRRGESRFDFLLSLHGSRLLTEVKSVTLVTGRRALFPDAPTARGARHVKELTAHVRRGGRAAVVFVVQRPDADAVSPHRGNDPAFALALDEAARAGVWLLAYVCRVTRRGVRLVRRIPVRGLHGRRTAPRHGVGRRRA